MSNVPITVANGDGIGPEIMGATLDVLKAAGAKIDIEMIDIGEKVMNEEETVSAGERVGGRVPHALLVVSARGLLSANAH